MGGERDPSHRDREELALGAGVAGRAGMAEDARQIFQGDLCGAAAGEGGGRQAMC